MRDKTNKLKTIFLPTLIGLIVSILYLQVVQSLFLYINHVDLTEDGTYIFQPIFDFEVYLPIYIITLLVAFAFQYFLTNRILDTYKRGQTLYKLKLWQLTILGCIVFGILFGFGFWEMSQGGLNLVLKVFVGTVLGIVYWTSNLLTVHITDNKRTVANKGFSAMPADTSQPQL